MKLAYAKVFAVAALAAVTAFSATVKTTATFDCYLLDAEGRPAGVAEVKTAQMNVSSGAMKVSGCVNTGMKQSVSGTVWGSVRVSACTDSLGNYCSTSWDAAGSVDVKNLGSMYLDMSASSLSGSMYWSGPSGCRRIIGTPRTMAADYASRYADKTFVYALGCNYADEYEELVGRLWVVFNKTGTSATATVMYGSKTAKATVYPAAGKLPICIKVTDSANKRHATFRILLGLTGFVPSFEGGVASGASTNPNLASAWETSLECFASGTPSFPYIENEGETEFLMVGLSYESEVTLDVLGYPAKFTASGLPPGVKLNAATGEISGTPTKAGFYRATIKATSLLNSKWSHTAMLWFEVSALPEWAQGTFYGAASVNGSRGPMTMTVSSAGKISGKLTIGAKSYSFSGTGYDEQATCVLSASPILKIGNAQIPLYVEVVDHSHYFLPDIESFLWEGSGEYFSEESIDTPIGRGRASGWGYDSKTWEDYDVDCVFWQSEYASSSYWGNCPVSTTARLSNMKSPWNYYGEDLVDLSFKITAKGSVTVSGKINGVAVSTSTGMFVTDPFDMVCSLPPWGSNYSAGSGWGYLVFPEKAWMESRAYFFQYDFYGKNGEICWMEDISELDFFSGHPEGY